MIHTNKIYAAYTDEGIWATGTSPEAAVAEYAAEGDLDRAEYPVLTAEMTQRFADHIEAHGFAVGRDAFAVMPNGGLDYSEAWAISTASDGYLVAVGDVAKLAGVNPETVNQWTRRHADFRALGYQTSGGWVWLRADAEAWLRETGRLSHS